MTVEKVLVGLDIGGTKTAVQIVDELGNILATSISPTVVSIPSDFVNTLVAAIEHTLAQGNVSSDQIIGIGVGIPGLVNPETGDVRLAVNLNLEAYPLGEVLRGIYHAPVAMENDVRMAAVGLYDRLENNLEAGHLAYLSIGTGVSAGIILHGKLHRGANGMAGEIGHIVVDPTGMPCRCGQSGCLETIISGTGIKRQWLQMTGEGTLEKVTAATVYKAAKMGDEAALYVVDRASEYMARAIQILFMTYDVELVILGGGVSRLGPDFLDPIAGVLNLMGRESYLSKTMLDPAKVRICPPDFDPALWGSIIMARELLS